MTDLESLTAQLLASNARERVLREALANLRSAAGETYSGRSFAEIAEKQWKAIRLACDAAHAALAFKPSDDLAGPKCLCGAPMVCSGTCENDE